VLPGIPLLVLAIIPSNQKEAKTDAFFENNTVLKELIKSNAKLIGLYFDGAAHDRSWIGKTYSENSSVFSDLNLILDNSTPFTRHFPIKMGILNNCQPLISGTDVFYCIKKAQNMHNGSARVCSIGNFIISTEHLCYLKEKYGNKLGLMNEVLNPKDKQADELAKRFFSSNVLKEFPNIFNIDLNMLKISKAISLILQSVGINYKFSKYSTIIQNALHTLKHNYDNDTSINNIDDNDAQIDNDFQILEDNQIDQMLLQHQHNGSIELAAALRYEQMYSGIKPIRTKGHASWWTTACRKKHSTSYIRAEMLDGVDASRIQARLFDLAPNSDCEFTLIIDCNRTQFVCEAYPFWF
ncbi:19764_t:CDS:2, partial [Gigaspora margarita]